MRSVDQFPDGNGLESMICPEREEDRQNESGEGEKHDDETRWNSVAPLHSQVPGFSLHRMGYGAMQLSGPEIFGPPRDVDAAMRFSVRRLLLA